VTVAGFLARQAGVARGGRGSVRLAFNLRDVRTCRAGCMQIGAASGALPPGVPRVGARQQPGDSGEHAALAGRGS